MPELFPILKGLATRVPGLYRPGRNAAGGSIDARYCYTVWLRHLQGAERHGLAAVPAAVGELGPGLSLGLGLAALLTGASRYVALDVSRDASAEVHARLLPALVALCRSLAPVPDDGEFPEVLPRASGTVLPLGLADGGWRDDALAAPRVAAIEASLARTTRGDAPVPGDPLRYVVPWAGAAEVEPASLDLVVAQAVMEHVDDCDGVYRAVAAWLRPGGHFSAAIDFRSHGLTRAWNGHWTYSPALWRQVTGARRWHLNRLGCSAHVAALQAAGFEVLEVQPAVRTDGIGRRELAPDFRHLTDDDLQTAGAYVLARRRA